VSTELFPLGQSSEPPDYEIEVPRKAIPAPGQPGTLREQLRIGQGLPPVDSDSNKPVKASHCRDKLAAEGRRRKEVGMAKAILGGKCLLVAQGVLEMLQALQKAPDQTATIDDATSDLSQKFPDGGNWRGSVTRTLANRRIIEKAGFATSCRPSRHACPVTRWRLINRAKAEAMAQSLSEALAELAALKQHSGPSGGTGDE